MTDDEKEPGITNRNVRYEPRWNGRKRHQRKRPSSPFLYSPAIGVFLLGGDQGMRKCHEWIRLLKSKVSICIPSGLKNAYQYPHKKSDQLNSQVSQLTTGRSFASRGHSSPSWTFFSSFNFIASRPLMISLLGNLFRLFAKPTVAHKAMNHLVGSYWYHKKALR